MDSKKRKFSSSNQSLNIHLKQPYFQRTSDDNESDSSKRSSCNYTSYSGITIKEAEKELNISFNRVHSDALILSRFLRKLIDWREVENIHSLFNNILEKLKEEIYKCLNEKYYLYGYPNDSLMNEAYFQDLVCIVLDKVAKKFKDTLSSLDKYYTRREKELKGIRMRKTHRRVEFLVEHSSSINTLLIIEVKTNKCSNGFKQLFLALRDAYDLNRNGRPVYGAVSTVFNWIFVIYDGLSFSITETIRGFIFSGMIKEKDKWFTEERTENVLRTLYFICSTILISQEYNYSNPNHLLDYKIFKSISGFNRFCLSFDYSDDSEEARKEYDDYVFTIKREELLRFFNTHKDKEWFRLKYHPEESIKRKKKLREFLVIRRECFIDLFRSGQIDSVNLDINKTKDITKLLNTAIIKLRGGTDEDINVLDEITEQKSEEESKKNEEKRKFLHKTSSITLSNLPADATFKEIEQMVNEYPEYLRMAINEIQINNKLERKAWISFEHQFDVRDIYASLTDTEIRGVKIIASINKDLPSRVFSADRIASHKNCVLADIKHAAIIITKLDYQRKVWQKLDDEETQPSIQSDPMKLFGLESRNPLLRNLAEFLIKAASVNKEELLDAELSQIDGSDQTLERDESSIQFLDRLIYYLRIVHSFDFYNVREYLNEDEMPDLIGLIHVRGLPPTSKLEQKDVNNYIETSESKTESFLESIEDLSVEEQFKLGLRDAEKAIHHHIISKSDILDNNKKWCCDLCNRQNDYEGENKIIEVYKTL